MRDGVPVLRHHRRSLLSGGPRSAMFSRGGTLPVRDLNGERNVDSTRIIAALEGRWPESALYPDDPAERRRALELEDYFEKHFRRDPPSEFFDSLRDHPAVRWIGETWRQHRAASAAVQAAPRGSNPC